MSAEEFVKHLKEEILGDNFNYYFDTLPTPIKGTDQYWEKSKQLFHSLNDEQRNQLEVFTQLVMTDTISSIFSKLDNLSSYSNQEGFFEVTLNENVISGDLQETFLMSIEEDHI
ncbi:hypothetical protein [Myroides sp. LJL116]